MDAVGMDWIVRMLWVWITVICQSHDLVCPLSPCGPDVARGGGTHDHIDCVTV